ncbi:MAG: Ig-like domain-containing protein [Pseudomonadota bacterium]
MAVYSFTVLDESQILSSGDRSLSTGDSFTYTGAHGEMTVWDNDAYMDGDRGRGNNEVGSDRTQPGELDLGDGPQDVGNVYMESYFIMQGSDGKCYVLCEIEATCYDGAERTDDVFAFYGDVPPEGVTLTVGCKYNVSYGAYDCLSAGEVPTTQEEMLDALNASFVTDEETAISGDLSSYIVDETGAIAEGVEVASISVGEIGQEIEVTTQGGLTGTLIVNADGSFTFTPSADLAAVLNEGDTDTLTFEYSIVTGTTTETVVTNHLIDFEGFASGDVITNQIEGVSIYVDATGCRPDEAMIFDSNNPTGGDWDLQTDGQNNILIISEDGDSSDADDNASGGKIFLEFDEVSTVESLTWVDIDDGKPATVNFYDANGNLISSIEGICTGDGDVGIQNFNVAGVSKMVISLPGSGAIDDIRFSNSEEVTVNTYDTAEVNIDILGLSNNQNPDAVNQLATTDEATAVTGNLLDGATDADGDALSLLSTSAGPLNTPIEVATGSGKTGTLTVFDDGTFTFVPGPDFLAMGEGDQEMISVSFTISDGNGGFDTADATIVINGINEAPEVINQMAATDEATPVSGNILDGASDANGDMVTVASTSIAPVGVATEVTLASGKTGTLTVNADGTFTFVPSADFLAMGAGDQETLTFDYTGTDGLDASAPATVTIVINGLNEAPEVINQMATTDEATPVSGNILDGASDANGDTVTVASTSIAPIGVATEVTLASGKSGTLTVNADGTYTFVPGAAFIAMAVGETEELSFTYVAEDGNGGMDEATVTIVIEGVNEAPDAVDQSAITDEATAVSGNVLDGATDPNGDPLTVEGTSIAPVGVATEVTLASGKTGTLTVNADGSYTFVPSADFVAMAQGETEQLTFTYSISDGNGGTDEATVTIDIEGINEAPDVIDQDITTDEDSSVMGNILDGATDPNGDPVTVESTSIAALGEATEVTFDSGKTGTLTVNADGSYTFVPSMDFQSLGNEEFETLSFTYVGSDGLGGTDEAVATITVLGLNDAPIVQDHMIEGHEDETISGDVMEGAFDAEGDILTVNATSVGPVGTPVEVVFESGKKGTLTVNADGTYTFVPSDDFDTMNVGDVETFVFSAVVTDPSGAADESQVTITVNGMNDAPVGEADAMEIDQDNEADGPAEVGNVLTNDWDIDEGAILTVHTVAGGTPGDQVPVSAVGTDGQTYSGVVVIGTDGTVTIDQSDTVPLALGDKVVFEVEYEVTDEHGATDTATVQITVNGVNDAPVAATDPIVVDQDNEADGAATVGNVLGNDSDVDNGAVLTVESVNGQPVGTPIPVSGTGTDGQPYSGEVVISEDGTVTLDQSDTVPLAAGESVSFTVEYTVTDEHGATDTATVDITVNGVNDAPIAVSDVINVDQDGATDGAATIGNVLPNDTDVDFGDSVSVASVGSRQNPGDSIPVSGVGTNGIVYNGTVTIGEDGTVTLDQEDTASLAQGESVTFTVDYLAQDTGGLTDDADLTIVVNGVNDAPVAEGETYTLSEDGVLTSNLLTNDTDVDNGAVLSVDGIPASSAQTYTVTTAGGRTAEVTVSSSGNVSFVPGENFQDLNDGESDTFDLTYTVTDEFGATDEATATFVINGADDVAPVDPENQINLVFVIDNSISMFAESTSAEPLQDAFGNNDGIGNNVDLAVSYANNVSVEVALKQVLDEITVAPEDQTAIVSKVIGFGDTAQDFGEYAALDPELAAATFGMDQSLGGSNFTVGLEAAEAYILESAPVEQTVIYFISDGESTSQDYMDVKARLEAMGNVEIEAVAVSTGIGSGGGTADLLALDTEGDIDVLSSTIDVVIGATDAAGEFDFT